MNSYLFPEFRQDELPASTRCTSIARSWCDPSKHSEVVGIDFGSNIAHYYKARCKQQGKMAFRQLFAWLVQLPSGTLVVCESAHLGVAQTSLSLAQPFTAEQLLDLYSQLRSRGVTLKLAPHAHTGKRMRLWVYRHFKELMRTAEKTDAADALALAVYVDQCNGISLANPYASFDRCPKRDFGIAVVKRSTAVLNAERTSDYRGEYYPTIMRLARKVRQKGGFPSLKFVATVASSLFGEEDGTLFEFTYRDQRPGKWLWLRHVVRMTPWHHRGGVARSNHMWHTFRPYLQRRAKKLGLSIKSGGAYKKFALHSDVENTARTSAMKSYREMLARCREMCIGEAARMGASQLDLAEHQKEASYGR